MAQTEHLPIYQRTYDLCLHLEQVVRSFPRYQKYSLGTDLRDAARRALRLVVRANSSRNRADVLFELRETLEERNAMLRLAQDGKAFQKFSSFEHAVTLVVDIAKQNEGWLKHQRDQRGQRGMEGVPASSHGQDRRATPDGIAAPSAP